MIYFDKSCRFLQLIISLLFLFQHVSAIEYKIFSNSNFFLSSKSNMGGFVEGTIDFFLTETVGDRVVVLSEITIHPMAKMMPMLDLERLQVGYAFDDRLRIRMGRFHNIMGFWNITYHHGLILHTTMERPNFLQWEHSGGLIPTHVVGLWAEGRIPTGPLKWDYGVMLTNGPHIRKDGPKSNDLGDDNENKAVSFNLTMRGRAFPFSGLGAFGNISQINVYEATDTTTIDQIIVGAHLFHMQEPLEIIGEYYQIMDEEAGLGESFASRAYFAQLGFTFLGNLIPYLRFEQVIAEESSPFIQALKRNKPHSMGPTGVNPATQDYTKFIGGIRYNLNVQNAFKLEYRKMSVPGASGSDNQDFWEMGFQWAFSL